MRAQNRRRYLMRAPSLIYDILFRGRYDFTYDLMPFSRTGMTLAARWNLLKAGLNLLHRRPSPYCLPIFMQVELTNYCNLKCPVCPTGIGDMKRLPAPMDPGLFESLMGEAGPYLLVMSMWAWGESLLHPELAEILRIARKYDVATLFSTNGQNLDDERVLSALIEHPPTHLIVALDGLTDETNSKYRLGAKIAPALAGTRRLAEMKQKRGLALPILHMRFMAMQHNQHEIPRLREFAAENMFDMLSIRTLSIIDSSEEPHQNLVPETEGFRAYEYTNSERARRNDYICQHPFISPTVFVDGTVVSCEQDFNAQLPMGVMSPETSFSDIWFGIRAAEVRRKVRDHPEELSFCRKCPFSDRPINTCTVQAFDLRNGR